MFGLNDYGNPLGLQDVLDAVGNLCRHFFLDLESARERLDNTGQLADTDDLVSRQVPNMRFANNGRHVVLAVRFEFDVARPDGPAVNAISLPIYTVQIRAVSLDPPMLLIAGGEDPKTPNELLTFDPVAHEIKCRRTFEGRVLRFERSTNFP